MSEPVPLRAGAPAAPAVVSDLDLLARDAAASSPALAALGRVRARMSDLESTQRRLTDELIATQDRVFAMRALAQINVQGVASDQTVRLLLEKALELTGARSVLLLDEGAVLQSVGDERAVDSATAIAAAAVADATGEQLSTAEAGAAIVGTLDPDGGRDRRAAFFRDAGRPFSTVDVPLIEAIVSALGVMLAFTELHEREVRQAAVEREHQLASALAQSVIDEAPPRSSAVEVFARTVPASLTGGDFYVFGEAEGAIWFAVGDVAGKGLPAAMLMTRAVAACRIAFLARRDSSVIGVFSRIEDELYEHLDEIGIFITLVVGVIDEATGTVRLVNAGHSPVVRIGGDDASFVPPSVPPLGVVRGLVPEVACVELSRGEVLVLGSDGLAEQEDPSGRLFGYDRFLDLCRSGRGSRPASLGAEVFATVAAFAEGSPSSDDTTLVVLAGREDRG
ncbi:SpoIIE family protein phosphatase [Rathayibacter sp. VKM Ac-2759]|uniref:PP2C family protein-serine/threonine phosphatase n=1 Tax=Rathayibacter sp. VKM Ac-2759 TaxID=2609252 RepID=UPI001315C968|nr:PP2C family protein-serine/threonine phosphatase [Rathayibacter sp. VKM Ac-2759]QHC68012.1 SpoIIE family protein phosphatase [Rathayibacter sp. VKM Ac-2759]